MEGLDRVADLISGSRFAHSGRRGAWVVVIGLCTGWSKTWRGPEGDFAPGGGGQTLLLAGFSGATQDAGNNLNAAEATIVLAADPYARAGALLTCRRWPEWGR